MFLFCNLFAFLSVALDVQCAAGEAGLFSTGPFYRRQAMIPIHR